MIDQSLSEEQDSLQKQKIEGFKDYSNTLNTLSAKQFSKFLITTEEVRPKVNDLRNFVKNGIKPFFAVKQLIEFFTAEGDLVLDVFSGTGETLKMLSDLDRQAIGIERDSEQILNYKHAVLSDSFLKDFKVIEGDALEVSTNLKEKFDFIFVDPPVKSHRMFDEMDSIGDRSLKYYTDYLVSLLDSLSFRLKEGKYLVCLLQDFYFKGQYFMLPAIVANQVSNLKFKGIKIYSRQLDVNNIPNKRVYAPVQNHFYALIFTL